MKKYIFTLLSLFMVIFLVSCDTSNMVFYNHEYKHSYDEESHYDLCDCGDIINKEKHNIKTEILKEATCSEVGQIKYYCDCGYSKIEEIPMVPHEYTEWATSIDATCLSKGQMERHCENCSHTEYKEVPVASHTEVAYDDLDSNCIHEGHIGGSYCSVCHTELTPQTKVEKTEHDYSEWVTTKDPTCISEGLAKRTCKICKHEEYKELDKIDHTPVAGEKEDSTCNKHGHTEGVFCSYCHQNLEAQEELPFGDHNYSIVTTLKEPNYNEEGIKKYTCSVCGDSYEEAIPRLALTQDVYRYSADNLFAGNDVTIYFEDYENNKVYDIRLVEHDGIQYTKVTDLTINKTRYYYYDGTVVIESATVDGYKHSAHKNSTDPYFKYTTLLKQALGYSSWIYDELVWDSDMKYYKSDGTVYTRNYHNSYENAEVAISLTNDGVISGFAYMSDSCFINLQDINPSPVIEVPQATHHNIVNGACDYCHLAHKTYNVTKDQFDLTFALNYLTDELEFNYEINDNSSDVNFVLYEYNKTKIETIDYQLFHARYYEGKSPLVEKTIADYTFNQSTGLLKITYSNSSVERISVNSDLTGTFATTDSQANYNPYNDAIVGKTITVLKDGICYKYTVLSKVKITIETYKDIYYYIINNDYKFIDYNDSKLSSICGGYYRADSNGIRPDGSKGNITFILNADLSMTIYYGGISDSFKAFNNIKITNITGTIDNYYIYFMGDNENYVLNSNSGHYIISKVNN